MSDEGQRGWAHVVQHGEWETTGVCWVWRVFCHGDRSMVGACLEVGTNGNGDGFAFAQFFKLFGDTNHMANCN